MSRYTLHARGMPVREGGETRSRKTIDHRTATLVTAVHRPAPARSSKVSATTRRRWPLSGSTKPEIPGVLDAAASTLISADDDDKKGKKRKRGKKEQKREREKTKRGGGGGGEKRREKKQSTVTIHFYDILATFALCFIGFSFESLADFCQYSGRGIDFLSTTLFVFFSPLDMEKSSWRGDTPTDLLVIIYFVVTR